MPRRFQYSLRALLLAMLVAGAAFGWLVWSIECPVCHGGNVDAEGRCQLGDECPYYGDWDWWRDSRGSEKAPAGAASCSPCQGVSGQTINAWRRALNRKAR